MLMIIIHVTLALTVMFELCYVDGFFFIVMLMFYMLNVNEYVCDIVLRVCHCFAHKILSITLFYDKISHMIL